MGRFERGCRRGIERVSGVATVMWYNSLGVRLHSSCVTTQQECRVLESAECCTRNVRKEWTGLVYL